MKRLALAAIPMLLILCARPALAQSSAGHSIAEREAHIAQRIDEGVRNGTIDHSEARLLRERLRKVQSLEGYYRNSHGFTAWERRDIERRLNALSARLTNDERAARRARHKGVTPASYSR
jgi:hypothetical protein